MRFRLGLCWKFSELNIPELDFISVILQENRGCGFHAEFVDLLVFAGCDPFLHFRTADFKSYALGSVDPLFDVVAVHEQAALVPFADRIYLPCGGWLDQVVESSGLMGGASLDAVGMFGVVQELVFKAYVFGRIREVVFHAAIADFADFPFKGEVEICVERGGDDVASASSFFMEKHAVFHGPSLLGECLFAQSHPAVG